MKPRNIVLVGFMGTGKTTVGRLVAARLGMAFVDMDDMIEEKTGKKIPRIFAEDGEPHFRKLEKELVRKLCREAGLVIAAGGGIVLDDDNIKNYCRSGLVVCLSATPEVILKRLSAESHRPLLEDGDKRDRILKIMESRRKLYDAVPYRVDTSDLTQEQAAEKIATLARGLGVEPQRA